jgi:hypothetical protein
MISPAIFGLAPSRGRADHIIHDLKDAGFAAGVIGVLFFDRITEADHARSARTPALSAAASESAGPIRGGFAGLVGIGRIVEPGVGSFIAAGPINTALHEVRIGAPGVAIARGLMRLGVAAPISATLEQRIKRDGHFLISVHSIEPEAIRRARGIFEESIAQDIFCTGDAAPAPAGLAS